MIEEDSMMTRRTYLAWCEGATPVKSLPDDQIPVSKDDLRVLLMDFHGYGMERMAEDMKDRQLLGAVERLRTACRG